MIAWILITAGATCAIFSLYVELRHKAIWERSTRNYQRPASALIHTLTRPSKISYRINIFLIWPVTFVLAIWSVIIGISLIQY